MKSYMLAHFGNPAEPEHPWDTEPVDWVPDDESHAVECFIGGHANETVCGRASSGWTIQTRAVYAADVVPRDRLCVLCAGDPRTEGGSMSYEYTGVEMTPEQTEEFGVWLNRWADLYEQHQDENRDFREGYQRAVRDIMQRFTDATGWGYKQVRKRRVAKP